MSELRTALTLRRAARHSSVSEDDVEALRAAARAAKSAKAAQAAAALPSLGEDESSSGPVSVGDATRSEMESPGEGPSVTADLLATAEAARAEADIKMHCSWMAAEAEGGRAFYVNQITGESQWEKPMELKTDEEISAEGSYVWLRSAKEGFEACRIVSSRKGDGSFEVADSENGGQPRKVEAKEASHAIALDPTHLERAPVSDLVLLPSVNEPMILHTLRRRFEADDIYTNIGEILVSVNPMKPLPIYTPAYVDLFATRGASAQPPHIFGLADAAYRGMLFDECDQSILISGESGAGKTEATKLALSYIAAVTGSSSGVEQRVLQANPILEAFGNARTLRNDNSSRFGKLVEVNLDATARVASAANHNYLLERSRVVVTPFKGERNFHIFYQLVAGCGTCLTRSERDRLQLRPAEELALLASGGCVSIDGVDDEADFSTTLGAIASLGITALELSFCLDVVGALIHMGELRFRRTRGSQGEGSKYHEGSALVDWDPLLVAADLLQVDPDEFHRCIVCRSIAIVGDGNSIDSIPLSPAQAAQSAHALSKTLYALLFDWLVARVNETLRGGDARGESGAAAVPGRTLYILDIFGFEIFERNSFEQLCINFANEKLQQHFNMHVFRTEEAIYEREGIACGHIAFVDNQPTLDLLESRTPPLGILSMLDEQVKLASSTEDNDNAFWSQVHGLAVKTPVPAGGGALLQARVGGLGGTMNFTLSHYAGNVVYDAARMVEKNGDKVLDDQRLVLLSSASPLIRSLFDEESTPQEPLARSESTSSAGARPALERSSTRRLVGTATIAGKFSRQLAALMRTLESTRPQFVRCIKPNAEKVPRRFDAPLCQHQLHCSGIFEATAIKKSGLPFRLTHKVFVGRYRCCVPEPPRVPDGDTEADWARAASELIAVLPDGLGDGTRLRLGRTMVLWRARDHEVLEQLRNISISTKVVAMQTVSRSLLARRLRKTADIARTACAAATAARTIESLEVAVAQAQGLPIQYGWAKDAVALLQRLRVEKRVHAALSELVPLDAETVFEALSATLHDCEGLGADFELSHDYELAEARAKVASVSKRREARACLKLIVDADALRKGLRLATETKLWDGEKPETAVLESDQEALATAIVSLSKLDSEESLLDAVRTQLFDDPSGVLRWEPTHEPILAGVTTALLSAALAASEKFGASTTEGLFVQTAAKAVIELRTAVLSAGAGEWRDSDRQAVEKVLLASSELHDRVGELAEAAAHVPVRGKVREVAMGIEMALGALHNEMLGMALSAVAPLGEELFAGHAPMLAKARQVHADIEECRTGFQQGLKLNRLDLLETALAKATEIGLTHYEQPAAVHHAVRLRRLQSRVATALDTLEANALARALAEADQIKLEGEEVEEIRMLLSLPTDKFLSEQLRAASRRGDTVRCDEIQMALKDLFFERQGEMFELGRFPRLRTAHEFANAKRGMGKAKQERREAFLVHQTKPIPTSLTQLDKALREEAVNAFKNILGYCQEAVYSFPLMLAQELIAQALYGGAELQTEIYVQLMKQLTSNPNPKSARLAWQLLALCLQCFPPDKMVEHFVERFLRTRTSEEHGRALVQILYDGVRAGALRKVPPEPQMAQMLVAADASFQSASTDPEARGPTLARQGTAMNATI